MNHRVVHSADIYRNHEQSLTRIVPNLLHAVIAVLAGTKHTSSLATESKNADQFLKKSFTVGFIVMFVMNHH